MARTKAVKEKKSKRKPARTINAKFAELLKAGQGWVASVTYKAGDGVLISEELLRDASYVPKLYPAQWLLDLFLRRLPNPPLHTQAKALLAAAGPGPYRCPDCRSYYEFMHVDCPVKKLWWPTFFKRPVKVTR